jgi:hypothetical protein
MTILSRSASLISIGNSSSLLILSSVPSCSSSSSELLSVFAFAGGGSLGLLGGAPFRARARCCRVLIVRWGGAAGRGATGRGARIQPRGEQQPRLAAAAGGGGREGQCDSRGKMNG